MAWITEVDPRDDLFHPRSGDLYWNESHLTSFHNRERNIMGTFYYYFRPNMRLAVGGPIIWDGDGQDVYNCLYYAWDQCVAMPDDANMNEFTLENGLTVKTVELQKQYRFLYEAPGVEMDMEYTALAEPHYMQLERQQVNPGIKDWMTKDASPQLKTGHYEQIGWMTGTANVHGETIEFDGPSLRDHTWGPRRLLTNMPDRLRGAWPLGFIDKDNSFQLFAVAETPVEQDPMLDTSERVCSGWYTNDGVKGSLVGGTRKVLKRSPEGLPLREVIDATDDLGRSFRVHGEWLTHLKFPCYSDCFPIWGQVKWTFDDGRECIGEQMDYLYIRHFRRLWEMLKPQRVGDLHPV